MSDQFQSMGSIGPMAGQQPGKEAETLNDPAKLDYKQGRELLNKGDFTQAAVCFHNSLKGFEEQGDEAGIANASDRLGDCCMGKNEFQMAIDNFQRASEICQKQNDSFSMLSLNKKIAEARRKLGEYDKALSLYFDIFDHYSMMRNPKGTVEALEVIADIYMKTGENQNAADTFRTMASIHRNFGHTRLAQDFEAKAGLVEKL